MLRRNPDFFFFIDDDSESLRYQLKDWFGLLFFFFLKKYQYYQYEKYKTVYVNFVERRFVVLMDFEK